MNWYALIFGQVVHLMNFYSQLYEKTDLMETMQEPNFSDNYNLPTQAPTFDFIVVGGGTAGCLVANRLASKFKVLVLEAGGDPPPQASIPANAPLFGEFRSILYDYRSVPQAHVSQHYGGILELPAGKVLGGTSTLNYMFFNRGSPLDFDNWAMITEDESWNYENLLPHFKAFENYKGDFPLPAEHGFDGELSVSSQSYAPGSTLWEMAGRELGYGTFDPNGPQRIGFSPVEYSKDSGRRESSFDAFIRKNHPGSNLIIQKYANVEEILFDESNTAYGVRYVRHGFPLIAHAAKEIIISAGAFESPKLLLKSGVGPAEELRDLGIKPILDLPVGKNLLDHPSLPLQFQASDNTHIYSHERNLTDRTIPEFLEDGVGPLTSVGALSAQAFLASSKAVEEGFPDWADLQLAPYFSNRRTLPNPPEYDDYIFYCTVYLGRVRSRGTLKLDPNDINGFPLIDLQMLSDPWDVEVLLDGITRTLEIFERTLAFQRIGVKYPSTPVEGCEDLEFRSEEYWRCYIRMRTWSGAHLSGSCRMGKNAEDPRAVVDSKLRVLGAQQLRVIDASVMPEITNTNIQAAVYAIAQKASSDILSDYPVV